MHENLEKVMVMYPLMTANYQYQIKPLSLSPWWQTKIFKNYFTYLRRNMMMMKIHPSGILESSPNVTILLSEWAGNRVLYISSSKSSLLHLPGTNSDYVIKQDCFLNCNNIWGECFIFQPSFLLNELFRCAVMPRSDESPSISWFFLEYLKQLRR